MRNSEFNQNDLGSDAKRSLFEQKVEGLYSILPRQAFSLSLQRAILIVSAAFVFFGATMLGVALGTPGAERELDRASLRTPASKTTRTNHSFKNKQKVLNQHAIHEHDHTIKGSGSLEIEIKAFPISSKDLSKDLSDDATVALEASIMSHANLMDLEYIWILPENVSAPHEQISGTIGYLGPGESIQLSLPVTRGSKDAPPIHLHVFRKGYGEVQGQMAQINLNPEATAELAGKNAKGIRAQSFKDSHRVMQ